MNRKMLLSTLWVFVVLNYLYCDVVSLMDSNLLKQYLTGTVNGMVLTRSALLAAGILMEISIAMGLLSRLLPHTANRWANILAGAVTTAVQALTLFAGPPASYYLFFSIIEIAATASVIWLAWTWRYDLGAITKPAQGPVL